MATLEEYDELVSYLVDKKYPDKMDKKEKRQLRQKAKPFSVNEGVLMHLSNDRGKERKWCRVVVDLDERDRIVRSLHADQIGGAHYGQAATIRKVTDRFYWRSITTDTRDFVRSCEMCQKANPSNKAPPSTLHPIAVKGLFHRWGIDLVGPLVETPRGNRYLVVATEYLTRWPEEQAIPDKTAEGVHKFLMGLVFRFGACQVLLHDQGREFNNHLVNGLCEELKITVAMTSAYHPQTNETF